MPVYQVSLAPTTAMPTADAFSTGDTGGAMGHDVAKVVTAIELRRHWRLIPDPDRTPVVAGARHPFGDAASPNGWRAPATTGVRSGSGMRRQCRRNSMAVTTLATSWPIAPPVSPVEKASAVGIAVVGASDTWYTGMLSYYAEIAATRGLVSMIASNASPWVAPFGATEGRLGTNPICFGFPSADEPVIWDVGTSAIIHAEVTLARRLGQLLPAGVAFDSDGAPTRDPAAA